jgi:hypothetical protein
MVQAADLWQFDDPARPGRMDRPELGCITLQREVAA